MLGLYLFLSFIVLPAVELWLLVQIGRRIGWLETLGIIIGTGLLGGYLAKHQGVRAWREVRNAWAEGRVPGTELVAGALFLVGAAFLLTPGVITDVVGLLMMVPAVRAGLARRIVKRAKGKVQVTTYGFAGSASSHQHDHGDANDRPVDVPYRRKDDEQ